MNERVSVLTYIVEHPDNLIFSSILISLTIIAIALWIHSNRTKNKQLTITRQLATALEEVKEANSRLEEQYQLLEIFSKETADVFLINVEKMISISIKVGGLVLSEDKRIVRPYDVTWEKYIQRYVYDEDKQRVTEAVQIRNLLTNLQITRDYSVRYRLKDGEDIKNYQVRFAYLGENRSDSIVFGIRCIEDIILAEKEQQQILEEARTIAENRLFEIESLNRKLKENNDIIANSGYGIWRIKINENGCNTMEANEVLQKILGIGEMNLGAGELYRFYHERLNADVEAIEREDYTSMEAGELKSRVLEWNHPMKGSIFLNVGGTCYIQADGEKVISGYCGDITEQRNLLFNLNRRLEEALLQAENANKAKSRFLFNMSHDIRTPINAIVGYTELMLRHDDDKEKCRDYLHKIQSSSDFLLSLINNVLEMARIESDMVELDEAPVKTGVIVEEVVAVYSELLKQKNIEFIQTNNIRTKYVYMDKVKTKEILLNLLSNAYKYTTAGGKITLTTNEYPCEKEGNVMLETIISDTGIGMAKDFLPKLFDEFSRERNVRESQVQGTGLGMPIVKKLVDLMGGSITVESEQGKGTTFVVRTIHKKAGIEEIRDSELTTDNTDLFKGKRILLAEDNDLNAEIAMEILQDAGLTVERAVDGIECVNMLQKAKVGYYNLILMDVQMPNMNGYKATRTIRAMEDAKRDIIIIAMTANAFEEDKKDALEAGMDGHIAKPINIGKLMEMLAKALSIVSEPMQEET